ncbi:MAG: hypothetical protein QFF03_23470 [Pseudomonadota bacterium]|nr:hypothetical protein [Pseudomonadota bacterium]
MFGLFGARKAAQAASATAPELGAALQKQPALPGQPAPAVLPSYPPCQVLQLRGQAPGGAWADQTVAGETQPVFRIPVGAGQPALAILADAGAHMQVWELSADQPARFVKQRPVTLDPAQASWQLYFPVAAACLPAQQVALSVSYTSPIMKEALYVYQRASQQFRRIAVIEPEMSSAPPFSSFETLAATPEAMLLLYRTGVIRLGAGNFAYQQNHLVLFSTRFPQGLEVLTLGIDDGNVRSWAMQGKTLWLQTRDKRKQPKDFTWSLDLGKVL